MAPWMKRRIEHARARCQKTMASHQQKAGSKEAEKQRDKEPAKTYARSR